MNLEEKVSKIVRQMVEDTLQKQSLIPVSRKKRMLILIIDDRNAKEVKEAIKTMSDIYELTIGYCGILAKRSRNEWCEMVKDMDLVVVPVLTIGTLVKISNLIDDEPASAIVLDALLNGKDVVVSSNRVVPSGTGRITVPPIILDTVSSHLQKIKKYGIHLTLLQNLQNTVRRLSSPNRIQSRPVVHTKYVRDWINEGETHVSVPKNALITPLAKEEAKDLGLILDIGSDGKEE
jgi:hypothetical protein